MEEILANPGEVGSFLPIIYRGFKNIPGGAGFCPSTVVHLNINPWAKGEYVKFWIHVSCLTIGVLWTECGQ